MLRYSLHTQGRYHYLHYLQSCLCVLLMLFFMPICWAQTLQICVDDQHYPPFTYPDREGVVQMLVRAAVADSGWEVAFISVPRRRCYAGLASGLYQAAFPIVSTPGITHHLELPQRAGDEDVQRSFGMLRVVTFRARGSQASWDGQQFSGLQRPVLYGSGVNLLHDRLAELGVPGNDSAKSVRQIMEMLVAGRGEIAIGSEHQVMVALQDPQLAEQIEVLPSIFMQKYAYLGFHKGFYAEHGPMVEALWTRIGELRETIYREHACDGYALQIPPCVSP